MKNKKKKNVKFGLSPGAFSYTLAIVLGSVYLICVALYIFFPSVLMMIGQDLFHGIAFSTEGKVNPASFVSGFIYVLLFSLIFGRFFAIVYNKLS